MTIPPPTDTPRPTRLARALASGSLVVSVELTPPSGADPASLLDEARFVAGLGVEFVNITDAPLGRPAMDPVAASHLVQGATSLEAIAHVTTRDRTVAALEANLLGAHALGVRNVLALTGDPARGDAETAWEVDAIGLLDLIARLDPATSVCSGVAFNHAAPDIELEVDRLARKHAVGASFAVTQPFFDIEDLDRALERVRGLGIPMVAGVLPLRDADHAAQLDARVDGIDVPAEIRASLERASAPDDVGIELAGRFLSDARQLVSGFCLMPSPGHVEAIAPLVELLDPSRTAPSTHRNANASTP